VVDYYSNTKYTPQEEGRPNNNATGGGEEWWSSSNVTDSSAIPKVIQVERFLIFFSEALRQASFSYQKQSGSEHWVYQGSLLSIRTKKTKSFAIKPSLIHTQYMKNLITRQDLLVTDVLEQAAGPTPGAQQAAPAQALAWGPDTVCLLCPLTFVICANFFVGDIRQA
jgi:hypothetical protein